MVGQVCSLPPENAIRTFTKFRKHKITKTLQLNSRFSFTDRESVHTRGHNLRLYNKHCNVNCRLNAFVCRNINVWNRLPAHVLNSGSRSI